MQNKVYRKTKKNKLHVQDMSHVHKLFIELSNAKYFLLCDITQKR